MFRFVKHIIIGSIVILLSFCTEAQSLDRAFKDLALYNFYSAKNIFTKKIDKNPVVASYGLALLYSGGNPFHNVDSAHHLILFCDSIQKTGWQSNLLFGSKIIIDSESVAILHRQVDSLAWVEFSKMNAYDLEQLSRFIIDYAKSHWIGNAIILRDSLAFEAARHINSISSYKDFLARYPGSEQIGEALTRLNRLLFKKYALKNDIESYAFFIQKYPDHPFRHAAEDSLFRLFTADQTLMSYVRFVRQFKGNPNVTKAWQHIYNVETYDLSPACFERFLHKYPDYPVVDKVLSELELSRKKLYPFSKNGLWGYIDTSGNIIIEPRFQWVGKFREGVADVGTHNKTGFVRKNGEMTIAADYDDANYFSNGICVVYQNNRAAFINKQNKLLYPFKYDDIGSFEHGIATIELQGKFGYLTKNMKVLIPPVFSKAYDYSEGLLLVKNDSLYGYLSPSGDTVIPFLYNLAFPFWDSIALVKTGTKWGIIGHTGEFLIAADYDKIGNPVQGFVILQQENAATYFHIQSRSFLSPILDAYASMFVEGNFNLPLAKAAQKGKFGIIDQKGEWVIQPKYNDIEILDTAIVALLKDEWVLAGIDLHLLNKNKYNQVFPFKEGLARVVSNGNSGYVDKKGNEVIPLQYEAGYNFDNGYCIVKSVGHYGLIDKKNQVILPFLYDAIEKEDEEVYRLAIDEKISYWSAITGRYFPE